MRSGYAPVNEGTLYYETAGSGQPLIFVHGMGLDNRMWDEQFHAFSDNFHVIRYDLRGFGKSSLPAGDYAHHTDLYDLMQHLGIAQAHLVGLSMGGRVIIDFAITHPEAVLSLIMVDAVVHGFPFNPNPATEAVNKAAREHGPLEANKVWLKHDLFIPANRNPTVAAQLEKIVGSYSGWHWVNKNPWIPIAPQAIHQLHKISAPSLVIVGEEDIPDFRAVSDLLHEKISGSEKIVMPGVGHMSNMEGPATFNSHVRAFLSGVAAHGA